MTSRQRVYTAIKHSEPDKVPRGEIEIAPQLVARLLGRPENQYLSRGIPFEDALQVREMLRMDLVCVEMDLPKPIVTGVDSDGKELIRDIWGNIRVCDKERIFAPYVVEPVMSGVEHLSDYEFPDIETFSAARARLWKNKTDYFVFVLLGGVFETARLLCGLEELCYCIYSNLREVQDFLLRVAAFQAEVAEKAATAGADAILISDDFANNKATLLSPDMMSELVFPALKELVNSIKQKELFVFLHCDGNINEVLPDIVDCGFDGLQALQPSAGMSLAHVKRHYGDRLCLMGNIDLDYILPFGRKDEVEQAVKEAIEAGAPGGGYILSTCNILTQDIPVENVHAMYGAAEKYGCYTHNLAENI